MSDTLDNFDPIETSRLFLRLLREDDAGALARMTNDPAITSAIHFLPTVFTQADASRLIAGDAAGRDRFIGIWERGGAELLGVVGAHLHQDTEAEIGYWVGTAAQGRGIASEAAGAVITALRRAFPDRQVIAECRPANTVSWHLLEKLGFRATGRTGRREGRQRLLLA